MSDTDKKAFEAAGAEKHESVTSELFAMLKRNKKYWLLPIVAILLVFGILIILGSTAAAPFIYSLF